MTAQRFRVATYNIHKCRGLDRRIRPRRIVSVLREIEADIIALQEVLSIPGSRSEQDQARFLADELGFDYQLGENRKLRGGAYGNLVLSRFPLLAAQNYDLSVSGREKRGCLRADVMLGDDSTVRVYNVHLGTAYRERPHQARRLLDDILNAEKPIGPRIMLGDFNEWVRGVTSRLLAGHFGSEDIRFYMGRSRTYPGVLPFLHLDHIYFDNDLELDAARLHRSRTALLASDHLPIVADLRIASPAESAA